MYFLQGHQPPKPLGTVPPRRVQVSKSLSPWGTSLIWAIRCNLYRLMGWGWGEAEIRMIPCLLGLGVLSFVKMPNFLPLFLYFLFHFDLLMILSQPSLLFLFSACVWHWIKCLVKLCRFRMFLVNGLTLSGVSLRESHSLKICVLKCVHTMF